MSEIVVENNEEEEGPVPHVWRNTFEEIVKAFTKKDYNLSTPILNVDSVPEDTANQIKEYIKDYGEELIELPNETWNSSVYIYYGNYWNILIDLYTKNEGLSDLVLNAEIRERDNEYIVDIKLAVDF